MARTAGSRGSATRDGILDAAADVASIEGLEGLSIGGLASALDMSKSGLFAHFGSKEQLQLAVIERARRRYVDAVIRPGIAAGEGIVRLDALCAQFLSYVDRAVFPGGCFFASAMAEVHARPDGPVRTAVVTCQQRWMDVLTDAALDAIERRELRADVDSAQVAFTLEAALITANWYVHLFEDRTYLDRGRQAVADIICTSATPSGHRRLAASRK